MPIIIQGREATARDVREFLRSKSIKRERVRLSGGARASQARFNPQSRGDFTRLRVLLRENHSFDQASDHIDALEHELSERGWLLPTPDEFTQSPNYTLRLRWRGVVLMVGEHAFVGLIGGVNGRKLDGIKPELLDVLQALAMEQLCPVPDSQSSHVAIPSRMSSP